MQKNLNKLMISLALIFTCVFSACIPESGYAPGPPSDSLSIAPSNLQDAVSSIDEPSIRGIVQELAGYNIEERGSIAGRTKAKNFIADSFASYGLDVFEHPFVSSSGTQGVNVEGILPGSSGKHLYISAHYDSVNNAGAEDDASGIASVMMAARGLAGTTPRDTIHFVAFDLEEAGLVGSYYYLRDNVLPLGKTNIVGDIQADMVGHNDGRRRVVIADCSSAPIIVQAILSAASDLGLGFDINSGECSTRSDHARFANENIPAVYVMDDSFYGAYPWYHQETDTIDRLDFAFLTDITKAITGAVYIMEFS